MKFITLENQPAFPVEDVSQQNFDVLELMMLHEPTIVNGHFAAEGFSYLYTASHDAFSRACREQSTDPDRWQALSFGMTAYEAMSSFLCQTPDNLTHNDCLYANKRVVPVLQRLQSDFSSTIAEAHESFSSDLPRASRLIAECATRFCGSALKDYAVAGAGLSRQAEVTA